MNPRIRPRRPASIGSNQASPANSPCSAAALLLSLSMAWSPPALERRSWLVEQAGDYATQISHHTRDGTVLPVGAARGQGITVDGRLSPAQTLAGPNYAIGANLGRQVGGNLFHSFGAFGLNRSETATFSGPANVGNIIGRVTGGAPSAIDGIIRSSIQGANLYLINPAGVVFGPNARVNV